MKPVSSFPEEEEEDDFLALISSGPSTTAKVEPRSLAPVASPTPLVTSPQVIGQPQMHVLHSDTENEPEGDSVNQPYDYGIDSPVGGSQWVDPKKNSTDIYPETPSLTGSLTAFYSRHNFANLDKVEYLVEKFRDRKWELWELLSVKYKLSVNESRKLWVEFELEQNVDRIVFNLEENCVNVSGDSDVNRKVVWLSLLMSSPTLSEQQSLEYSQFEAMVKSSTTDDSSSTTSITRDVERTHQDIGFFQFAETKQNMIDILTVYAKVGGLSYVQGMNEICGLIYFVMQEKPIAFWCLNSVMAQLKDLYTAEVDSTSDGVYSRIDGLQTLVREYDHKLYKHLQRIDFPIMTIAMRWVTTVLAMDVFLPDALRIWDVALKSVKKNELISFSIHLVLAYLLDMSPFLQIIQDRQECIEYASHFGTGPDINIEAVIANAVSIHVFETVLRGRYAPSSDEPILEVLSEAVDKTKTKVTSLFNTAREKLLNDKVDLSEGVNAAKSAVTNWFASTFNNQHQ